LMGYLANTPAEVENLVIEIPSIESENRSIPIEDLLKNLPDFTSRKKEPNELKEELSAVEKVVPFDQFILFAKDANSALQFIDDSKNLLIDTLQGSINDYSIESIYQYYEEQIGIKSKDLLKSETIKSVAITSGDESFMLGTSIAVIVESEDSQNLFQELIKSRKGATDARLEEDSSANWAESVLLSPNGLTSSYIGKKENIIILSNNKNQFDRLKEVCHGKRKSLEQSDEYKLFISKNKKELDGGWFYITDDAMSRISSPAMRIAAYRRALALAVFQRCEYHHLAGEAWDKVSGLDRLGKLEVQNGKLRSEVFCILLMKKEI